MTRAATENCVICFGPRECVGGHVHRGDEIIFASTCKEHWNDTVEGCKGCYGEWKPEMGYEANYFIVGVLNC